MIRPGVTFALWLAIAILVAFPEIILWLPSKMIGH